ncbi:MAG: MGMT family protein [Acidobacteria bacterium]|nr:MGMT family protein [Acidobacteriota bacterium]
MFERHKLERALLREASRPDNERDAAILAIIRLIPKGRTAAYSAIAAAAGYPMYHRLVAKLLHTHGGALPWQRVTGVKGEIKLHLDAALEQRMRLEMEGVQFHGKRIAPKHILSSEDLVCLRIRAESRKSKPAGKSRAAASAPSSRRRS